jgi:hypothetical protein
MDKMINQKNKNSLKAFEKDSKKEIKKTLDRKATLDHALRVGGGGMNTSKEDVFSDNLNDNSSDDGQKEEYADVVEKGQDFPTSLEITVVNENKE